MERAVPPDEDSLPSELNDDPLRIELRWSKEAIAQAAYEMTFWYMEEVGKIIYSATDEMPKDWRYMTPAEAGRNAAKMMLYYAILRCRTARESQRAIALTPIASATLLACTSRMRRGGEKCFGQRIWMKFLLRVRRNTGVG